MEFGIAVLCVILIFAAYIAGRVGYAIEKDKKEKSDYEKMNESINHAINDEDNQPRNLLIKTLKEMGCQPEIDDNNDIIVKYQGEVFSIDASNDNNFIWIYDIGWKAIETSNTDADFLKQAINKVNQSSAIMNLYTEGNGYIMAHCKMAIYFAYNIPNYREYLKYILDVFFLTHQQVIDEFASLTKIQKTKERVEIKGFRSNRSNIFID